MHATSNFQCTGYMSKHNTVLISAKADGRKCSYAKKWAIPIVNVQWLTDIMLGHFVAMNQMDHQTYQQYPAIPNFNFDPKLVPNLMGKHCKFARALILCTEKSLKKLMS